MLLFEMAGEVTRKSAPSTFSRKTMPSRHESVKGQGLAVTGMCFVATNKMAFSSKGEKYGPPLALSRMKAVR